MCNGSFLGTGALPEENAADHRGAVRTSPRDRTESGKRRMQRSLYGPPSQSLEQIDQQLGALLTDASSIEQPSPEAAPANRTPQPDVPRASVPKFAVALIAAVVLLAAVILGARLALGTLTTDPHKPGYPQQSLGTPVGSRNSAQRSVLIAQDSGARRFAAGSAVAVSPGVFHYSTAAGDTFLGIASRFHVCIADLDGGRPLADQGLMLTAGTAITVELGTWPTNADGTVDCVWDK